MKLLQTLAACALVSPTLAAQVPTVDQLVSNGAAPGLSAGRNVAIDGRYAAVLESEIGSSGAVVVWRRETNGSWTQEDRILPIYDPSQGFGTAIALDGDTLVIGSVQAFPNGLDTP
ncbi:MAG: hypothetical protein AAF368_12785, partial [Planctomycetota bacterium]